MAYTWHPHEKKAFGSFQSADPEQLIRVPDAEYEPPARLAAATAAAAAAASSDGVSDGDAAASFGRATRDAHFSLDPSWTFVNHGAFGASCRAARRAARRWADHAELQPLRFIDRELFPLLCHSLRRAAALVRAPPTSLALVPNATYALWSVIRSIAGERSAAAGAAAKAAPPTVCMLDIGYGSVQKMLRHASGDEEDDGAAGADGTCGVSGGCDGDDGAAAAGGPAAAAGGRAEVRPEVRVLRVRLPCSRAELASQVVARLPANAALLVLDAITSNTGIVMPVAEIVAGVRRKAPGCLVLVDGAHSLGQLDVDLSALDCDFFVSNCHKWLCSARGLGLLYVRTPALAARVRAAVVSHGFGSGFTSEFLWDGCRDYSAAVALPELLDWWAEGGRLERARDYCRALRAEAVALLCAAWGTRPHMEADCYANMACIELPAACLPPGALTFATSPPPPPAPSAVAGPVVAGPGAEGAAAGAAATSTALGAPAQPRFTATATHGKMLQDALHFGLRVECPVKVLDARCYVRISAMIYNERACFEALAAAVLRIRWRTLEDGGVELALAAPPS